MKCGQCILWDRINDDYGQCKVDKNYYSEKCAVCSARVLECPECGSPVEVKHTGKCWMVTCTDDQLLPCPGMPYAEGETRDEALRNWLKDDIKREELEDEDVGENRTV